jgi:putative endonuclease
VEVSQVHKLFDSYPNAPPVDPTRDIIFGAFDGKNLIAATYGSPARENKKRVLWSKFLIVDSAYRRQGIGFGLKQFQRSWALSNRYTAIAWVFNPFETSLAKFYFHHLGATASDLCVNTESNINADQPSYNLEVVWRLKNKRVKVLAAKKRLSDTHGLMPFVLEVGEHGEPIVHMAFEADLNATCRVEIPPSITNSEQAPSGEIKDWYQALKASLSQGFLKKYTVSDFEIENGRCWYVLTAPMPWYLYVLECSDNTLYTGITPDLNQRLKLHNAGRGALYTASRTPVHFVATWKFLDRSAAMRAEIAFKRLSRERKLQHINSELDFSGVQFLSPVLSG